MRVTRVLRNSLRDLQFGTVVSGTRPSRHRHLGAKDVNNSDYAALDDIFPEFVRDDDVLVDVGCGRGRVILWWLANGHRTQPIYGLELDEDVATATAARLARFGNVRIVAGDACANIPPTGTLFYLYNPFDADVMARFAHQFRQAVGVESDPLILYANPKYLSTFEGPAWQVRRRSVGPPSPLPFDDLAIITYAGSTRGRAGQGQ